MYQKGKNAALSPFDYITNIRIYKMLCNRCLRALWRIVNTLAQ